MSTIYETVRAGQPLRVPFIDVHGHFGPWPDTLVPRSLDYGRVIAEMDRYGCDQVWMTTANPGYSGDIAEKNDFVFDFADAYPDRIIPYCVLSAHTPERNVDELRRCLGRGRCIGVKMHVYRQPAYALRSDFMQPVLELLNEHRLAYLNHTFNVEDLAWALERYPEITFIGGHFSPAYYAPAFRHPNFRLSTCAAMDPGGVEQEVRRTGYGDRFMVGSDFSLFQLGFGVGMLAYADLDEALKEQILGRTALTLLERTRWFERTMIRKA